LSERLLNTEEAARFLRVSEASIRRWSDAGLLPARRVGGRRERRFTETDLQQFLGKAQAVQPHAGAVADGIKVGGVSLPVHSHIAAFYSSDAGRLRLTVPFIADGLRAGQPCVLVASGDELRAYDEALRRERVDIDGAAERGLYLTVPGPGVTAEVALDFWEQRIWPLLAAGHSPIRVAGEMTCEREIFSSDAEMMKYEVAFNLLAKRFPTVTICQYDVREFDGETIFQALRAHPDLYGLHLGNFLN
jgi:excisionase family DNA binding protein